MSKRKPAGDKGTADRIEADNGGYWVRLVTKQALLREGECMKNCLRDGVYADLAGDEDMLPGTLEDTLWSLRKACGTSYALAKVSCCGSDEVWWLGVMKGPCNSEPSPWCVQQVRHLRDAYRTAGADLRLYENIALAGLDGMTYRPDVAPVELRELAERRNGLNWRPNAGRRVVLEEVDRYEVSPATVLFRPADAPPGTPFRDIGQIGQAQPRRVVVDQASRAQRREDAVAAFGEGALTVGVDTQPATMDVSSWADANLPLQSGEQYGGFASFIRSHLDDVVRSIGVPYEETVGDWRRSAERARIATELDATVRMTPLRYPGDRT